MAGLWHWVIALCCIASFCLSLFVCLLIALLNVRATRAVTARGAGPEGAGGVIRDRHPRAGAARRSRITDRIGYPSPSSNSNDRPGARGATGLRMGAKGERQRWASGNTSPHHSP